MSAQTKLPLAVLLLGPTASGKTALSLALAERYLTTDYARLARITAERLWRGRPAAPYYRLVAERRYQPGVEDLVARLRRAGLRIVIVSSGSDLLAARARDELGVDDVAANGLGVRNGRISGELSLGVSDSGKAAVAMRLLSRAGITPDRAAAVGDSGSDVGVARTVALSVAYNSKSPELLEVSSYVLGYGELPRLAEILEKYGSG